MNDDSEFTIVDMLKITGWIESMKFQEFVSKRLKISTREVRRRMKIALKNKEILKGKLEQTRTRFYGLAEFGPPDNYCYKIMYFDCGLDKLFGDKPRIIWESE